MSPSKELIDQQTNLELALMRGEISLAELLEQSAALGLPVSEYLLEPAQPKQYQPITITVEQLEERAKWELMLMRGVITLDDALAMQMGIGVPIGDYTRRRYEGAVDAYKDTKTEGAITDLAEPFGIKMNRREKKAQERESWLSHLRFVVDAFSDSGLPKTDPGKYEGTAFHAAADRLHRAPSTVFDDYYGKQKKT